MSALLSQLEGRERRAECLRNDEVEQLRASRQRLREALEGLLNEAHTASSPLHRDSEWSRAARVALADSSFANNALSATFEKFYAKPYIKSAGSREFAWACWVNGASYQLDADNRRELTERADGVMDALDELRALLCAVLPVGQIDGYDVIRRASVIDLIDRRRAFFAECEEEARAVMRGEK